MNEICLLGPASHRLMILRLQGVHSGNKIEALAALNVDGRTQSNPHTCSNPRENCPPIHRLENQCYLQLNQYAALLILASM